MVDLGRWLNEAYVISEPLDDPEFAGVGRPRDTDGAGGDGES
jgi:endogenous inhibitor of DNA gyrase (YacG/DUF329 family)